MIEGSGDGSVPHTNGSGYGRVKNIRIRIPSTVEKFILNPAEKELE
jgi:hypothetical protein